MREDPIALRVAARFQREVVATFIPDTWFKEKRAELVSILKIPMPAHRANDWAFYVDTKVGDFLTKFKDDFEGKVTYAPALESIQRRVKDAKSELAAVVAPLEVISRYPGYVDFSNPTQYLKWVAGMSIQNKIAEVTKTLAGFFKWGWSIDEAMIDRLVKKTLKAASPEQLNSLTAESTYSVDTTRQNFLSDIRFNASALKALKRTRIDKFDPLKWFDWTYKVLKANYTEQAVEDQGAFREFDMYGMKIVIDDSTVGVDDIKQYVKYINRAHEKLKAKGFGKSWYGTIFIRCEKCGGVNQNTGREDVGGHYHIGPDTVTLYERPSGYTTYAVVHELGHRYWFKQMNSTQRAKFNSLVKVRPTAIRPSESDIKTYPIDDSRVKDAHSKVDEAVSSLKQVLDAFRKSKLRWFAKIIDTFYEPITKEAWDYKNGIVDAVHSSGADSTINSEVKQEFSDLLGLSNEVHVSCLNMGDDLNRIVNSYPDGTDFNQAFRTERSKWLEQLTRKLDQSAKTAHNYITLAVKAFNEAEEAKPRRVVEDWERKYQEDTRPVKPVSDYGGSNIDEAFAEVFTHYVLEKDLDRDQLESFKSVFSSIDLIVDLVAQRYLQLLPS